METLSVTMPRSTSCVVRQDGDRDGFAGRSLRDKIGAVRFEPAARRQGDELRREDRIVFRYCDRQGQVTEAVNPNGSRDNIAGICNRERNVMGLMPHPERACEDLLGSSDGRDVFRSLAGTLAAAA